MVIKNFKPFKPTMGGDVPIIGQTPPPQIRDALGRVLQAGDFIILNVADSKPWRVQAVTPLPQQPGLPPNQMQITLSATVQYLSHRDVPNVEFLRVMTREEVDAMQAGRISVDRPDATPSGPSDETPTLKDA